MRLNEAPDKIYINSNIENRTWLIGKGDSSFIEYIKKDAFIEKVCSWLEKNATYIHPRNGKEECIVNLTLFRDYMKGE